jgi:hypothetical protein
MPTENGELGETLHRPHELQALDDAPIERDEFVFGEFRQVDGRVSARWVAPGSELVGAHPPSLPGTRGAWMLSAR